MLTRRECWNEYGEKEWWWVEKADGVRKVSRFVVSRKVRKALDVVSKPRLREWALVFIG